MFRTQISLIRPRELIFGPLVAEILAKNSNISILGRWDKNFNMADLSEI
jgi:hypothetical protein